MSRTCPECSERLSDEARRCVCGWERGARKGGDKGPSWDSVCTWHYGGIRCQHPVGFFDHGTHGGFCIFHRASGTGSNAAEIAHESGKFTQEQYIVAAKKQVYGVGDNPVMARIRAGLRKHSGGSFSDAHRWLKLCEARGTREPGQDDAE